MERIKIINISKITDESKLRMIYLQCIAIYNSSRQSYNFRSKELTEKEGLDYFKPKDDEILLIAIDKDITNVIGFDFIKYYSQINDLMKGTCINSIYLKSQHRGQGLGAKLLNEMKKLASVNFHTMLANICAENERSIRFFKKHSFVQQGNLPGVAKDEGRYRSMVIMQLKICET